MHPEGTKNYWQQNLDAQWRNIWKLIWRPSVYIFLLQSKSSGFISTLWMPRVESGIGMMPQNQISLVILLKSNSLGLEICVSWSDGFWGMFWVGFWSDPPLGNCWVSYLTNPPQATERPTLQSQESRNPGSVFTIALGHKPTQCYEIV